MSEWFYGVINDSFLNEVIVLRKNFQQKSDWITDIECFPYINEVKLLGRDIIYDDFFLEKMLGWFMV